METPPRRRNPLIRWLLGEKPSRSGAALEPLPIPPDVDDERGALLHGAAPETEPPDEVRAIIPREMFRVNVSLPAHLDPGDGKPVPVKITNISGTGAAILFDSPEPLAPFGEWLDLALPNRSTALELELQI